MEGNAAAGKSWVQQVRILSMRVKCNTTANCKIAAHSWQRKGLT